MAQDGQRIGFELLNAADLIVDATYEGGTKGNTGDDPLSKLIGCGNQGGFRFTRDPKSGRHKLAVLYSSLADPDWPDYLDVYSGLFVYYGDNKKPGHALHDTPSGGNRLLREIFGAIHATVPERHVVPPFFIFTKGEKGRDVVFRGLAVPGANALPPTEDLVAVWQTVGDRRFQNYRSTFTILDVPVVSRAWIQELQLGTPVSNNTPITWQKWVETGSYTPLQAPRSIEYRSKEEQLPVRLEHQRMLKCIYEHFKDDPFSFEACAVELMRLMDRNVVSCNLTRRWMDGGRDALGKYRIGSKGNEVLVEFALEAKCFEPGSGAGVKATSRLVSRLRHRQFGVFVTTSYVALQAYKEIKEDAHPVIIVSGADIVRILADNGHTSYADVQQWLLTNFPRH